MSKIDYEYQITKTMLEDYPMNMNLYRYELKQFKGDYLKSLLKDKDDFIFAITAHKNDVAMILIEPPKRIYKNEDAKKRLKRLWKKAYSSNIKKLMPHWVNELENERIPYQGIKMLSM